jgi:hypothetical protein
MLNILRSHLPADTIPHGDPSKAVYIRSIVRNPGALFDDGNHSPLTSSVLGNACHLCPHPTASAVLSSCLMPRRLQSLASPVEQFSTFRGLRITFDSFPCEVATQQSPTKKSKNRNILLKFGGEILGERKLVVRDPRKALLTTYVPKEMQRSVRTEFCQVHYEVRQPVVQCCFSNLRFLPSGTMDARWSRRLRRQC